MDISIDQAREILACPDIDPVDRIAAHEVLIAHHQAQQMLDMRAVAKAQPAEEYEGHTFHPAAAEIASALHWTTGSALSKLELGRELLMALPEVFEALDNGRIDLMKAREIADRTRELAEDVRADLAWRAVEFAASNTSGQLRAWLARELIKIDADAADRRRKRETTKRRVWVQPEADGMATLGAYLTAEEAQACIAAIRGKAAGTDGPIRANEADAMVSLLTGIEPGAPVPVQIVALPDNSPYLVGYGPITESHAAWLSNKAPKVVLERPAPTMEYAPTVDIRRWVQARDRHCRFPGCRRPAPACDLDHIVNHPQGPTSESNLQVLCRFHHWPKTHARWKVNALEGMCLEWTSPQGRVYITHPWDP